MAFAMFAIGANLKLPHICQTGCMSKKLLPTVFDTYFRPISTIHNYRTRLSSKDAFSLPRVRTNYGIFNIRFSGVKVWNALEPDIKLLSMSAFKARLKSSLISKY